MEIARLHSWDVSADEAVAIQRRLRALVVRENGFDPRRFALSLGLTHRTGTRPMRPSSCWRFLIFKSSSKR